VTARILMRIPAIARHAAPIAAALLVASSCANQAEPEVETPAPLPASQPTEAGDDPPDDTATAPTPVPDDGLRLPDTILALPSERELRRGPATGAQGATPAGVRSRPPTEPPPR